MRSDTSPHTFASLPCKQGINSMASPAFLVARSGPWITCPATAAASKCALTLPSECVSLNGPGFEDI